MLKRKLQVFISSTFTDLIHERQAAVAAVLKAGHIPAGMELFTAGDKSQWDTITRWIDESDVYMLILGGRYGSIEPSSRKSYTELEYDYAVQTGKPLFSVVIKEDALELKIRAHGTSMMEKEFQVSLTNFRKKVLSSISSFFGDEKDVRLAVHESLAEFRDSPNVRGWISAAYVEDPKPLHDEIGQLRVALDTIKREKEILLNRSLVGMADEEFFRLVKILRATDIVIPKGLIRASTTDTKSDLLYLFINCKDSFFTGVTNTMGNTGLENFLYFELAPKLMLHALVLNEETPGSRVRRISVSPKGLFLLEKFESRSKLRAAAKGLKTTDVKAVEAAAKLGVDEAEAAALPA
jgi:hypothetical protein